MEKFGKVWLVLSIFLSQVCFSFSFLVQTDSSSFRLKRSAAWPNPLKKVIPAFQFPLNSKNSEIPESLAEAEKAFEDALASLPTETELSFQKQREFEVQLIEDEYVSGAPVLQKLKELAPPPFDIRVPGEQGNETLTTDPMWLSVILTLKFLGIPVNVVNSADFVQTKKPCLVMGDEILDDPQQIFAVLCEQYVLSDLVESIAPVNAIIKTLFPSFESYVLNTNPGVSKQLKKELLSNLTSLNKRVLKSRGEFIEDDEITIGDLILAHQLHHMKVALKHFKNFEFSKELSGLVKYIDTLHEMEVVQNTMIPDEVIIKKYEALRTI